MRPIAPLQSNIASLRIVLPDDACPTMARLRMSAGECGAMLLRMKPICRSCKLREQIRRAIGDFSSLLEIVSSADRAEPTFLAGMAIGGAAKRYPARSALMRLPSKKMLSGKREF